VPINDVANSPLLDVIISALSSSEPFDAAVECICAIFKETRDVDECLNVIRTLYPRIVSLRPAIAEAVASEDTDTFRGLTRVFAEAGEAWVVLIARLPTQFRNLVEAILECAARDKQREAISSTFAFWYELKQLLTLDKYLQARLQYVDIYSKLVDFMIEHLEYPTSESGDDTDLFQGDRELEDKFREFRHEMGDVLKDCCEVIGVTECLQKSYAQIQNWVNTHGSEAREGYVPAWQKLEAPLFSMRAMGRMVPSDESIMLPRLVPLIVQIPDQEKVRFQAVMALGRYTEWTSQHPETLEPQLNFIMAAFQHPSKEVVRAAALSFKFFCNDCADLLKDYTGQLQQFYETVIDKLPATSQDEVTDGVASVVHKLPADRVYENLKLYCDPVIKRIVHLAHDAVEEPAKLRLAGMSISLYLFKG
jgi:transportin-3